MSRLSEFSGRIGGKLKTGKDNLEKVLLWVFLKFPLNFLRYSLIELPDKISGLCEFKISRKAFQYGGWIVFSGAVITYLFFGGGNSFKENYHLLGGIVSQTIEEGAKRGFEVIKSNDGNFDKLEGGFPPLF
jgi:hypothetical protein